MYCSIFSPPSKDKSSTATKDSSKLANSKASIYHFTKRQKNLNCLMSPTRSLPVTTKGPSQKRTLLFDLDETLIHCVDDHSDPTSY